MPMRLERWLEFLRFNDESRQVLQEFVLDVEPYIDGILDRFYTHIANSDAAKLFASPESMLRARQAQRHHWMAHVLVGRFDEEYVAVARNIGRAHHRLGVDVTIYSSGYSVVLNSLVSLITVLYQGNIDKQLRVHHEVNRAIFLDMGMAISAYYDTVVGALEDMSNEVNFSLARAGEFRDNETGTHLLRMSRMCEVLALAIGRDEKWARMIRVASPLHDVGKIGIPDNILLKAGRLEGEELDVMRRHPEIGGQIIPEHPTEVIQMAKRIALTHHERWDGTGYPAGLKGAEIPLEGRIAAICDVYDALLSPRPYKKPWSKEHVIAYVRDNAGLHFDPELVAVFLRIQSSIDAIQQSFDDNCLVEWATDAAQ